MLLGAPAANFISAAGSSAPPPEWRGVWLVVKDLGAPGISAITDAQAGELIGASILIVDGTARFVNDNCDKARYTIETQTIEDFLLAFRLTPTQLPLRGKRARTLEVSCSGAPFHDLSLLETGCAIVVWKGRVFQVVKREPELKRVTCIN